MHTFCVTLLWEFVQNLPVICCFAAAVWLWSHNRRRAAAGILVIGSVSGALVIRFTEVLADGGREAWSVTLVNAVVLSMLQVAFAAYTGTEKRWSSWRTDLLLGIGAGVGLAVAQGLAAPGISMIAVILHSTALGISGGLVLVSIRLLKGQTLAKTVGYAIGIALAMTVVIGIIDYGYMLLN